MADFSNIFAGTGYTLMSPEELEAYDADEAWRAYGRGGGSFFPQTGTSITTAEQVGTPDVGMYGFEQPYTGLGSTLLPAGWQALTGTLGAGYDVAIGTGGAERALIAEERRQSEQAVDDGTEQPGAIPAALDYVQGIPGAAGEAGGELLGNLFAGATEPLTAIPGDLLGDIPTWVPLLGAAYLLTRK